jgi:hypothetical protein
MTRTTTLTILFFLLGIVLGFIAWRAYDAGYFEQWQKTNAPPRDDINLLTAVGSSVYIETGEGETYRCTTWARECWIKDHAPQEVRFPEWPGKPCDFASPEFSLLTNRPWLVRACFQSATTYPDGYGRFAYVLDQTGDVWEWSHTTGGLGYEVWPFCFVSLGVVMGGLAAALWQRSRRYRSQ